MLLHVCGDWAIRHVGINLQNHSAIGKRSDIAISRGDNNCRGSSALGDGGGSEVSGSEPGWKFYFDVNGS